MVNSIISSSIMTKRSYVTECWGGKRISLFQLDGQFNHINIAGSDHLNNPHYIAVNSQLQDHLSVAGMQQSSHCLYVYTGWQLCEQVWHTRHW